MISFSTDKLRKKNENNFYLVGRWRNLPVIVIFEHWSSHPEIRQFNNSGRIDQTITTSQITMDIFQFC